MTETTPAHLNSAEEAALRELLSAYEAGQPVGSFIAARLASMRSTASDGEGGFVETGRAPQLEDWQEVYRALAEKGMLAESGRLTSDGRCYFIEKKAARRRERRRIWSDRCFQIGISACTIIASGLVSIAVSFACHWLGFQ